MDDNQLNNQFARAESESNSYDAEWAEVYATRYALRTPIEPLTKFLTARLGSGTEVLELCIGNGRVAIPLAREGISVTGVDNSTAMLDLLRRDSVGLPVEAVLGDCATEDLGREFPLVILLFNSLFLMKDREHQVALFANISRHLQHNGRLIVETFIPRPYPTRNAGALLPSVVDGGRMELVARSWDAASHILWIQRMIVKTDGSVRLRPTRFQYLLTEEQDAIAGEVGLEVEEEYADFFQSSLNSTSRNRIVTYRKVSRDI